MVSIALIADRFAKDAQGAPGIWNCSVGQPVRAIKASGRDMIAGQSKGRNTGMTTPQKGGRDLQAPNKDLETVKRMAAAIGEITEKSHHLINQYLGNNEVDDGFRIMHPAIVSRAFQEMAIKAWQHPAEIVKEQMN